MATKKKCLTITGLARLIADIRANSVPTETHYRVELTANQTYTFTVPNYSSSKSKIELYLNGLRLIPDNEYTLSSVGLITLNAKMNASGNVLHVVHLKWS